jgi:hypothetical protein
MFIEAFPNAKGSIWGVGAKGSTVDVPDRGLGRLSGSVLEQLVAELIRFSWFQQETLESQFMSVQDEKALTRAEMQAERVKALMRLRRRVGRFGIGR